jgi:hypothetical protein
VTAFDFAGLAAQLAVRVRSCPAAVVMDRAALLRSMTALDEMEQSWRASLARVHRQADDGQLFVLLEELLSLDVLGRTWCAFVASSIDGGRQPLRTQNAAAMLSRTLLQQRRRVLSTVIDSCMDLKSLQEIDRHRRSCERWTDVLLSVFPVTSTTRVLQFDPHSCAEFAALWPSPEVCATRAAEPVILTAMKAALPAMRLSDDNVTAAARELESAIEAVLQYDRRTIWSASKVRG